MEVPRAGDIIRRISDGIIRVAIAVVDVGRYNNKRSKDRQWSSNLQVMPTGESKWSSIADWEVAWPGHGWIEVAKAKPTTKELDEQAEGGAIEDESLHGRDDSSD